MDVARYVGRGFEAVCQRPKSGVCLQPEIPIETEHAMGMEPTFTATGVDAPYGSSAVQEKYRREKLSPD